MRRNRCALPRLELYNCFGVLPLDRAAVLLKKACGIESGSGVPNKTKVAKISKAEAMKIAETKMPDLNAASIEAAYSMICGTARSMGITVEE